MKKIFIFLITIFMVPCLVSAKVKISNNQYETLEEAIKNSNEGDTITLLDDVDVTDTSKYKDYHNWLFKSNTTLDLNGHTITTSETANGNPNAVWLGNNLTIKNGYFDSKVLDSKSNSYFKANYALFLGDEIETSNITVENITVSTGINIYNTLNVTLKNVTSKGKKYYAVWLDEHATCTIESGNFSSDGVSTLGVTSSNEFISKLYINGGTFKAVEGKLSLSEQGNPIYYPPIITGGTFDFDVTKFVSEGYICKKENDKFVVTTRSYDRDIVIDNNDSDVKVEDDKFSNVILDTLKENNKLNIDNVDVKVVLNFENIVPEKNIIENMNKKIDATIDSYFDISIDVINKNSNAIIGNLTELNDKITLSIDIPNELKPKDGYKRKYYILREHNNIIDILETNISKDNKTLTFKTDLFSTYALAYKDIKIENIENPNTYDGIKIYKTVGILSLITIIIGTIYFKKEKEF